MATTTDECDRTGGFGVVDPFARVLAAVSTELGTMADAKPWTLDDTRLSRRLGEALAVQAAADELVARLVGEVDCRDLGRQAGASSTPAHLVASYRMSRRAAGETVARARGFGARTEFTRLACTTGIISAEQADVIVRALDKLSPTIPDQVVQDAQVDLVDHAQSLTFTQLQVVANHLVEVVDPDAADAVLAEQLEAEEARALQQTTFRGRRGFDGIARFSGKMPNLQFDMLSTALEAIASPRRNQVGVADESGGPSAPPLPVCRPPRPTRRC